MTTKDVHPRKNLSIFEYVLEDFLEVKASLDGDKMRPIKKFLFSQRFEGRVLSSVEGFSLSRQLVLIDRGDPHFFRHLVFLNPQNGWIRVRPL